MSFDNVDTSFSFEADPFGPVDAWDCKAKGAAHAVRFVPLVANPHVLCIDEVFENLAVAWVGLGRHPLIVDAASTSPMAPAAAALDLGACVQTYSQRGSYLAAGGLPRRYVDTHGSAARLLTELQRAAPHADTIVVHADATDLARIFKHRQAQPMLLAVDEPESLKQAYTGWKWLRMRCEWSQARLLLAQTSAERGEPLAQTLAHCAEQFMGASLLGWAALDPTALHEPGTDPSLVSLAASQVGMSAPASRRSAAWSTSPMRTTHPSPPSRPAAQRL